MVKLLPRERESIQEAVRRFRELVERSGVKKGFRRRDLEGRQSTGRMREGLASDEGRIPLRVEIHLPNADHVEDSSDIDELREATTEFLRVHGFAPDRECEEVVLIASWHWGKWFKRMRKRLKGEASDIYEDVKEALRRQQIDASGAESFQKRAEATAALLERLDAFDNAVVRLGDVFIAKAIISGRVRVAVHTLSPQLARALDKDPELAYDASAFFTFIDSLNDDQRLENNSPYIYQQLEDLPGTSGQN